jgi:hypothetical protein
VLLVALAFSCRDPNPCDPGYELIGPSCFPAQSMAAGGSDDGSSTPAAGAAGEAAGGASIAPPGNPNAKFGDHCTKEDNSECGGPAPVCATDPLFYCTQLYCQDGEQNAGACPMGWSCIKVAGKPSACVNLAAM